MESLVFIEFEYIFSICVIVVIVLMYLFYVKYTYNKDFEESRMRKPDGLGNKRTRDEVKSKI